MQSSCHPTMRTPDEQASEASLAVTQNKAECTALLANAEGIAAPMVRTKKNSEAIT